MASIDPLLSNGMFIGGIGKVGEAGGAEKTEDAAAGFAGLLQNAITETDAAQKLADVEARKVVTGQATDLTEAIVASEKAQLAMEFTVQVRNKIVDAYQELWRMPI